MMDILRCDIDKLPEHEKIGVRELLEKEVHRAVEAAVIHGNLDELQRLAQFVNLLDNNRWMTTPAENLVDQLVRTHYECGLNIKDAERHFGDFRDSFKIVEQNIEYYAEMYPNGIPDAKKETK
jgi:hypothetical protein